MLINAAINQAGATTLRAVGRVVPERNSDLLKRDELMAKKARRQLPCIVR